MGLKVKNFKRWGPEKERERLCGGGGSENGEFIFIGKREIVPFFLEWEKGKEGL